MKIEIKKPSVEVKVINGKNGDFELYQLETWAHLDPNGYPQKVVFQVEKDDRFEVGDYELLSNSFRVGSFDRLEISKAKLKKIKSLGVK